MQGAWPGPGSIVADVAFEGSDAQIAVVGMAVRRRDTTRWRAFCAFCGTSADKAEPLAAHPDVPSLQMAVSQWTETFIDRHERQGCGAHHRAGTEEEAPAQLEALLYTHFGTFDHVVMEALFDLAANHEGRDELVLANRRTGASVRLDVNLATIAAERMYENHPFLAQASAELERAVESLGDPAPVAFLCAQGGTRDQMRCWVALFPGQTFYFQTERKADGSVKIGTRQDLFTSERGVVYPINLNTVRVALQIGLPAQPE